MPKVRTCFSPQRRKERRENLINKAVKREESEKNSLQLTVHSRQKRNRRQTPLAC